MEEICERSVVVRLKKVRMLEVESWSKHSPSLGSSHRRSKQTREWRSWNPEFIFTTSSPFQHRPCLHAVEEGEAINYPAEEEVLGYDLPG